MQTNNNGRDRALYEKVLKMAPKGSVPTLATLREERVLVNNNGTYTFEFNEQRAGQRPTETLLSLKDMFVANSIALGILVERKTKPGTGVVHRYPSMHVVAQAGATNATDLESIFNGHLKAQIDQQVMMDKFSTRRFRHVPQGSGINTDAGITGAIQSSPNDGLVMLEPNLILRGTKKNTFTLTIPTFEVAAAIAATDAAFDVRVVLELNGFIIPGGAGLTQQ
ncbi:hypothetical protein GCM10023185_38270 [Hymenobacter saemangeumensis]|uniref:Uncharacterized protein n=1 Tax=Hymenobacter saemangeumensis TaxID=1084522 RepID=A0ABP8IQF2_9BACT